MLSFFSNRSTLFLSFPNALAVERWNLQRKTAVVQAVEKLLKRNPSGLLGLVSNFELLL